MSGTSDARLALALRSLLVQGSFNYHGLLSGGFAWLLIPVLRRTRADEETLDAALARHAQPFNGHPYLIGIAAGAVARMEADGEDPEVVDRFKEAIRGPLGGLGDRLIWVALRPTLLLGALLWWSLGGPPWLVVGTFLVPYTCVHLWLRWWGLRVGFEEGGAVAGRLRAALLGRWADRIAGLGTALLGVVCGVLASGPLTVGVPEGWIWGAAAASAFVFGVTRGAVAIRPTRLTFVAVVSFFALAGLG